MKRDKQVLVFFGDSLTEGYLLPPGAAYPALIAEKLHAAGLPFEVINAGVSGETAADGLRRSSRVLRHGMVLLLIAFGTNDLARGLPAEEVERNLEEIIRRARQLSPETAIVIAATDIPALQRGREQPAYLEMYRRVAAKSGAVLIGNLMENVAGKEELTLADKVHPNSAGQMVMAEQVWRVIEPLIKKGQGAS